MHFPISIDETYHKAQKIKKYIIFKKSFSSPRHTESNQPPNTVNTSIMPKVTSFKSLLFLPVVPKLNVTTIMQKVVSILVALTYIDA